MARHLAGIDPSLITPLADLPPARQAEIEAAVARPTPPPKMLDLGLAMIPSRAWYEWHLARGRDPLRPSRPKLAPSTRRAVIARDGLLCGICGQPVPPLEVHVDHIIPVARGGSDDPTNLQVAHGACNMRKGART